MRVHRSSRVLVAFLLAAAWIAELGPARGIGPDTVAAGPPDQTAVDAVASGIPSGPHANRSTPKKVYDLLALLEQRQGEPLPGYVGGREFHNRERRLPQGRYREYDVNPKVRGKPRDAERIVIDQRSGKAYYTQDHYRTFVPLN